MLCPRHGDILNYRRLELSQLRSNTDLRWLLSCRRRVLQAQQLYPQLPRAVIALTQIGVTSSPQLSNYNLIIRGLSLC